jgi:hypothetical protein
MDRPERNADNLNARLQAFNTAVEQIAAYIREMDTTSQEAADHLYNMLEYLRWDMVGPLQWQLLSVSDKESGAT